MSVGAGVTGCPSFPDTGRAADRYAGASLGELVECLV
jgi:hypothetical protein